LPYSLDYSHKTYIKPFQKESENGWIPIRDIEPKSPVTRRTLYAYLKGLVSDGFLNAENVSFLDKNEKSYFATAYQTISLEEIELPTKEELIANE